MALQIERFIASTINFVVTLVTFICMCFLNQFHEMNELNPGWRETIKISECVHKTYNSSFCE